MLAAVALTRVVMLQALTRSADAGKTTNSRVDTMSLYKARTTKATVNTANRTIILRTTEVDIRMETITVIMVTAMPADTVRDHSKAKGTIREAQVEGTKTTVTLPVEAVADTKMAANNKAIVTTQAAMAKIRTTPPRATTVKLAGVIAVEEEETTGIATKAFRPVAEVATITTTRGLCRTETRATITVATMAEDNSHIRVDSTWKMTKIKKKIVLSNKSDNTNNEYIRNKYNDVNVDDKNCEV